MGGHLRLKRALISRMAGAGFGDIDSAKTKATLGFARFELDAMRLLRADMYATLKRIEEIQEDTPQFTPLPR